MHQQTGCSRRSFLKASAAGLAGLAVLPGLPAVALARSGKKGFCGAEEIFRPMLGCDWYYNWSLSPYRGVNLPFAPMVWGWSDERTPKRLRVLSGRQPILFGFNEPDGRNQANMSVPAALDAWPRIQDLADEIVSPSCVNARGRWMTNFMIQAERRKLRIDSIGVHSYSGPNAGQVIERLEETYRLYGRPLWVTEIAVADWRAADGTRPNRYGEQATMDFMTEIVGFMNGTSWIKGYSWLASGTFGDAGPLSTSAFLDTQGRASPMMEHYASL
ncbi:glycosyl hydrolase [Paracoccus nototheniae]|uniref:Glycosyl hydrolase n=1 Tax=Paracoccus nototheniae TaxID=2489002 RepID=A0ABW4DY07_9RHOB|nr:glycosyl hydrolase [Paracoccus nototheniae]